MPDATGPLARPEPYKWQVALPALHASYAAHMTGVPKKIDAGYRNHVVFS